MSTATEKTAIAAVLSGVSGIGRVWKRERNPIDRATFKEAFVSHDTRGRVLSGWEIHLLRAWTEQMGSGEEDEYKVYRIRGYCAWKDDGERDADNSSDAWDTTIDGVRAAFRGEQTLDGTVEHTEPVTLNQNTYVDWYGVFCHFAEFELETRSRASGVTYS